MGPRVPSSGKREERIQATKEPRTMSPRLQLVLFLEMILYQVVLSHGMVESSDLAALATTCKSLCQVRPSKGSGRRRVRLGNIFLRPRPSTTRALTGPRPTLRVILCESATTIYPFLLSFFIPFLSVFLLPLFPMSVAGPRQGTLSPSQRCVPTGLHRQISRCLLSPSHPPLQGCQAC